MKKSKTQQVPKKEFTHEIWELTFNRKRYIFVGEKPKLKMIKSFDNGIRISTIVYDESSNLW